MTNSVENKIDKAIKKKREQEDIKLCCWNLF